MDKAETKNKDKAAFACVDPEYLQEGLTKREYFAAKAMQAMISNPNIKRPAEGENLQSDLDNFSRIAVEYSDSLIIALANER